MARLDFKNWFWEAFCMLYVDFLLLAGNTEQPFRQIKT